MWKLLQRLRAHLVSACLGEQQGKQSPPPPPYPLFFKDMHTQRRQTADMGHETEDKRREA